MFDRVLFNQTVFDGQSQQSVLLIGTASLFVDAGLSISATSTLNGIGSVNVSGEVLSPIVVDLLGNGYLAILGGKLLTGDVDVMPGIASLSANLERYYLYTDMVTDVNFYGFPRNIPSFVKRKRKRKGKRKENKRKK